MKPASAIPRPNRSKKATSPPADAKQTPIAIAPEEGEAMKRCAARCGQTVPEFVRAMIQEGIAMLESFDLTSIPCPFCARTDSLQIINWSNGRRDGTEYKGEAVKCNRCESITPAAAWARRGLYLFTPAKAETKGGSQ
jgi:hypothetical protein